MAPLITVVTSARNAAPFLDDTVASIVKQTITDWEYLIVENGSTDDTVAVAEAWARRDSRIRLIRCSDVDGAYAPANVGIRAAKGEYIARTDADDVSVPTRFEAQLKYLRARPGLRGCGAWYRNMSERGDLAPTVSSAPESHRVLRWYLCVAGLAHSTAFVQRSAFESIGLYRERPLAADRWMFCDLALRNWLGVTPHPLVHRRVHSLGVTGNEGDALRRSGVDAAAAHIEALTGERWQLSAVETLRMVGHGEGAPWRDGLAVLARWVDAWRRDGTLRPADRWYLERWQQFMRSRHERTATTGVRVLRTLVGRSMLAAELPRVTRLYIERHLDRR